MRHPVPDSTCTNCPRSAKLARKPPRSSTGNCCSYRTYVEVQRNSALITCSFTFIHHTLHTTTVRLPRPSNLTACIARKRYHSQHSVSSQSNEETTRVARVLLATPLLVFVTLCSTLALANKALPATFSWSQFPNGIVYVWFSQASADDGNAS